MTHDETVFQMYEAVKNAEERIENGEKVSDSFNYLDGEIKDILEGKQIYCEEGYHHENCNCN